MSINVLSPLMYYLKNYLSERNRLYSQNNFGCVIGYSMWKVKKCNVTTEPITPWRMSSISLGSYPLNWSKDHKYIFPLLVPPWTLQDTLFLWKISAVSRKCADCVWKGMKWNKNSVCLRWSNQRGTSVYPPRTHLGTHLRSDHTTLEVVWDASGQFYLCPQICPGPHWRPPTQMASTDLL